MSLPAVGYVIRMFPQTSETFIANEILHLERLGLPLRIYSYRRPRETVAHECVRLISTPVQYLPDPLYRHPWQLLRGHRALRRLEPALYRRTARFALAQALKERRPDTLRRFLQAGHLAYLIKNSEVGHLHAHFAHRTTQVAMLACMLTGVPFSFTAHAKDIYSAAPRDLRQKINAARFVVTCTRANQEHLRQLVEPDQRPKITLAYHGVDLSKFTPAAGEPTTEPPLILSVGRLVEKKGFPYLLEACRILKANGRAFRCLIVGEGPERRALGKMVRNLDLTDVVSLPGSCSQEDLVAIYRRATLFALPCTVLANGDRDGIPNVLLEAMAMGLPVVSSPISGIPEVVQSGYNGLLPAERDSTALASALELLLQDAALRQRLGSNARSTVARDFDARANAQRIAELFQAGALDEPRKSQTFVVGTR